MTAPPDPIRAAAEQLARELPLTGEPSQGVISAIAAAFRQQRAEAEHARAAEERDWDCKYGCDGRDSCLLPDALGRAEAAEARLAVLEAAARWALGEAEEFFVPKGKGHGRFWWRKELRERAALGAAIPQERG